MLSIKFFSQTINTIKINKEYERQIDQLVYKLYDLRDEEIKIIEEEIR